MNAGENVVTPGRKRVVFTVIEASLITLVYALIVHFAGIVPALLTAVSSLSAMMIYKEG